MDHLYPLSVKHAIEILIYHNRQNRHLNFNRYKLKKLSPFATNLPKKYLKIE